MILFIRNIPAHTRLSDLHNHVEPALETWFFFRFRHGTITNSEIITLYDQETGQYEHHGLVHLSSEKAGRRAIVKLRGKRFKNRFVVVRPYFSRSWHNDRRLKTGQAVRELLEKRTGDRRRHSNRLAVVQNVSAIFQSHETFTRKHAGG